MKRWLMLVVCLWGAIVPARGEVSTIRMSKGYGIAYLPLMVIEDKRLIEKHAEAAGLEHLSVSWQLIDGGNNVNDAILAGAVDVSGIGIAGFLLLWAKTKGRPALEVGALSGLSAVSLVLTTRNPNVRSLADLTSADRIALPGAISSQNAIVLQMAAAKTFGDAQYAKLDALTVSMPYPLAYAAIVAGKTEINAHFASPPYWQMEVAQPGIHAVFNSVDLLGQMTSNVVVSTRRFYEANPRTSGVVVDALKEADAFIASDPRGAAELFRRMTGSKSSTDDILAMIQDRTTNFSTEPYQTMQFASFLRRVGLTATAPASWKDYFFPLAHGGEGS